MRPASPTVDLEPDPNPKPQLHQQPYDDESSASTNHSITHDRQLLVDTPITQTLVSPAAYTPSAASSSSSSSSTFASASTLPTNDILEHTSHNNHSIAPGLQVDAVLPSSFPPSPVESANQSEYALGDEPGDLDVDTDMDMDMSDNDEGGAPLDYFPPNSASIDPFGPWENPFPLSSPQPAPVLTNSHGENSMNTSPATPTQPADTSSSSSDMSNSQPASFASTSVYLVESLQAGPALGVNDDEDDNTAASNPNPITLGAENPGLVHLLRNWAYQHALNPTMDPHPNLQEVSVQCTIPVSETRYCDLRGDACDIQGIDWTKICVTRKHARRRRCLTYKNYTNIDKSDAWSLDQELLPTYGNYFRFKVLQHRRDVRLAHFQLRNLLACPSRNQAFYPGRHGINCMDPMSGRTDLFLSAAHHTSLHGMVSSLDANHGVLMVGTFFGDYFIKSLDSQGVNNYAHGFMIENGSGITNHIQIHTLRHSSSPVAGVANNDGGYRIVDLATQKIRLEHKYITPVNCTAVSPDGRLRVMVGDSRTALIAEAERGTPIQGLDGHNDYMFSCAWDDDGYRVATGCQDKSLKIWDARRWCNSKGESTPLKTIRSELAGVRGLRFSPNGSGKKVLVAVEEADYINIIDAQTLQTKQTFDIFGEMGGLSFANDGQDLNVLCGDSHRGGLLQFERCGRGSEPLVQDTWDGRPTYEEWTDEHILEARRGFGATSSLYRRSSVLDRDLIF